MDSPTQPRRKRGINKISDLPQGASVEFNKFNKVVGKYRFLYGKYVGTTTRRNISILHRTWNVVPKEDKEWLWLDIKNHFRLQNDGVKKQTLISCGNKWRAFKNKLRGKYMLKNISPRRTWTFLEPRIWDEFCRLEHYTPEKLKRREIASERGRQQTNRPRLGSKGYAGFEDEWEEERNDPNKATEFHLIPCHRGSNFCLARARVPPTKNKKKDKHEKSSPPPPPPRELLQISRDLTQASEQLAQGDIEARAGVDAMIMVLGPEHGGRTRGLGGDIGYKRGIEGYVRKKRTYEQKQDMEEIENTVRQKILRDMKTPEFWSEMKEQMMTQMSEMSMEGREETHSEFSPSQHDLQSPYMSSVVLTTSIKFNCIKEATVCCLYVPCSVLTGEMVICARATVYPIGNGNIHGKKMLKGHMRVSVLHVDENHKSMELPVPDEDIPTLEDAIEGFIQWPIGAIGQFTGFPKSPTRKGIAKSALPQHPQRPSTTRPTMSSGTQNVEGTSKETTKNTTTKNSTRNEDLIKRDEMIKEENRKKLLSLQSGIDKNKCKAPKDGYNRWMCRDDCAEPFNVHVDKEIFRQAEDSFLQINATDIIELLSYEELETGILAQFEMSLYRIRGRSSQNKTCFLNPTLISSHVYDLDSVATIEYVVRALDGTNLAHQFYLAPYLKGNHWVLLIICPNHGWGFILDSLESSKNNVAGDYELTTVVDSVVGNLTWELPNVNRQPDEWQCGFYVMRWMHDFVLKYQNDNFPNKMPWDDERPLQKKEVDAIIATWFMLWRD